MISQSNENYEPQPYPTPKQPSIKSMPYAITLDIVIVVHEANFKTPMHEWASCVLHFSFSSLPFSSSPLLLPIHQYVAFLQQVESSDNVLETAHP